MEPTKCPSCGTPLAAGALAGQCPRCLLAADPRAGTTEDDDARVPSAAVAVLDNGVRTGMEDDSAAKAGDAPPSPGEAFSAPPDDADGPRGVRAPPEFLRAAPWSDRAPPRIEGYDVLRELKQGGQGVVYLAVQRSTKRKVAVKVLLAGMFASKAARRRFEREIELVSSLKHPNIIAVFDSGTTPDGHDYYVMDYVRGVPLTQYVRDQGLGLEQVLALFATTCEAVNHAHLRGVIHRDLKPSNILIDAEGNVRVLDFGLAKALIEPAESVVSVTGNVVGTFPYMSPEQTRANPDEMDTRTDVYALGVVLYEALTGKHPYPVTGSVADIVRHIVETPPAPPARNWSAATGVRGGRGGRGRPRPGRCPIDSDLETILLKALSKERERRYDNAGHFARDVRRYLADEPIVARRPSAWYQLRMFSRRHRALVLATIGIFSGLVVGVIGSTAFALRLRSANARAETEKIKAEQLQVQAEHSLASGLAWWGAQLQSSDQFLAAWKAYGQALDAAKLFHVSQPVQLPILSRVADLTSRVQVPLMGPFGQEGGVGGLAGFDKEVNGVVVCRDGWTAIACGEDGRVVRCDLRTGAALRQYARQIDARDAKYRGVNFLALSPDGARVIGSGDDGKATVWDVESGEVVKTLDSEARDDDGPRGTWAVAFSPDGRYALTGGDEYVAGSDDAVLRLWDLSTPRRDLVKADGSVFEAGEPHVGPIAAIAFRDPHTAVTASHDGKLKLWDLRTLRLVNTLDPGDGPEQRRDINDVVVLPDGRHAVTASFAGYVGLWDLDGGLEYRFTGHNGPVWRVAASADGTMVASAGKDGTTRVWNVAGRAAVAVLHGHTDQVMDVDFSPDRAVVVSGGTDRMLAVWAVPGSNGAGAAANPAAGAAAAKRRAAVTCVSVSDGPDRVILAGSDDGGVALWDASTERLLRSWAVHTTPVRAVRVSPDGTRATSVGADGAVANWDLGFDSAGPARAGAGPVECASFFPDGRSVLLSSDGVTRRWDFEAGKQLQAVQWPGVAARGLAVSGDGKNALAATADGGVRVLDLASGSPLRADVPAVTLAALALDRYGKTVISDGGDSDVRVWEVASRDAPRRLRGHAARVTAVALSSDMGCAASGAADGSVRAWDFGAAARYHEFETELSRADRTTPTNPALLAELGEWHAFRRRDEWAVSLLEQARRGGATVNALVLGRSYWRLGQVESARSEFREVVRQGKAADAYLRYCLRALAADPQP
jgi:WD40 repeat protein/serine/threonine protein kinase